MEYSDAVRELEKIAADNWRIGEIADSVEPVYGKATIRHLADDTGIPYPTMLQCRTVWRAYPENSRGLENSWAVYVAFAAQPDRAELVGKTWTVADARALVAERRESAPSPEPDGEDAAHDWAVKAEAAVRRALHDAGEPDAADTNWADINLLADIYTMVVEFLEGT